MSQTFEPVLEQEIWIDAPVSTVWALVGDVRRIAEWSPSVQSTRLRAGYERIERGAEFTNRNQIGEMIWTTHATIVRYEDEREIAFRVEENWVVWSFGLDAHEGGTRVTQRRDTPEGISPLSMELTDAAFGGQTTYAATLLGEMAETLSQLKAAAELSLDEA